MAGGHNQALLNRESRGNFLFVPTNGFLNPCHHHHHRQIPFSSCNIHGIDFGLIHLESSRFFSFSPIKEGQATNQAPTIPSWVFSIRKSSIDIFYGVIGKEFFFLLSLFLKQQQWDPLKEMHRDRHKTWRAGCSRRAPPKPEWLENIGACPSNKSRDRPS